jgi:hypothetical protein
LATNGPQVSAVNDLALIYKSDSGPSFPSSTARITALDQVTGEMVAAHQKTRRGRTERPAHLSLAVVDAVAATLPSQ